MCRRAAKADIDSIIGDYSGISNLWNQFTPLLLALLTGDTQGLRQSKGYESSWVLTLLYL